MGDSSMPAAAIVLLAIAAYAQLRVRAFTTPSRVVAIRAVLVAVGVAFGSVGVVVSGASGWAALWVLLAGFGIVHLPAAAVLVLKRLRGESRS